MLQLVLHMVGDYLLQNDWQAQNKKKKGLKGELACQIHCILYSIGFLIAYGWKVGLVVYVTHYLIDRFFFIKWYMNLVGQKQFAQPPTGPWSIFFVDNTFHLVCNYLAIYFLV